jgi:signal transduction histidine kinase
MRRLVGDLLLLARADAKQSQPHQATRLDEVLTEAASEIEPVAEYHELTVSAEPAVVSGARDELHRLVLNLIENAVKHTPPGTHIRASTLTDGDDAVLIVEDDGPGIPPALEQRVFERFVRSGRDGARGSGLGLAIVQAVTESHGGSVTLEHGDQDRDSDGTAARGGDGGRARTGHGGARFVIRFPLETDGEQPAVPAGEQRTVRADAQTSTTTGSTIGRRRSLS